MKKCVLTICGILAFASVAEAQESTAIKSQASTLSTVDARLESIVNEYSTKITTLKVQVQRIKDCAALGQIFDGVGCVNAVEENPHVASFGKTTEAGLPSCGANSMLKATGAFTFECEDVTRLIPVPECMAESKTMSAANAVASKSCRVSLGNATVGSQRAVSCSQGDYDIKGVFVCQGSAGSVGWAVGTPEPTLVQVRFSDCSAQNISLAGRCTASAPAIAHQGTAPLSCTTATQQTYATAHCDDGTLSLTNINSVSIAPVIPIEPIVPIQPVNPIIPVEPPVAPGPGGPRCDHEIGDFMECR